MRAWQAVVLVSQAWSKRLAVSPAVPRRAPFPALSQGPVGVPRETLKPEDLVSYSCYNS